MESLPTHFIKIPTNFKKVGLRGVTRSRARYALENMSLVSKKARAFLVLLLSASLPFSTVF